MYLDQAASRLMQWKECPAITRQKQTVSKRNTYNDKKTKKDLIMFAKVVRWFKKNAVTNLTIRICQRD